MLLKLVEYHWVEHIDDALLLLGRLDMKTVPLAGGTHLLGLHDDSIEAVIDLRDLGLAYISEDNRGIHIGAMTTLQQLVDDPLLKEFAAGLLARAALVSSSSRLVRNCATLGGTLATGIASQADLLTALVALDAEVIVRSASRAQVDLSGGTSDRPGLALAGVVYKGKQERRIPVSLFNLDHRVRELIVEVVVPRPAVSHGASLLRVGRTPTDIALLNVAASVEIAEATYQHVRLVFGGCNMEPVRMYAVERYLEGKPVVQPLNGRALLDALRGGMNAFRPPADSLVSSSYRRVSGLSMAYRALEEAMTVAHWRSVVSSERGV